MLARRPFARVLLAVGIVALLHPCVGRAADPPPDQTSLDALIERAQIEASADTTADDLPDAARQLYEQAVDAEAEGRLDEAADALDAAIRDLSAFPYEVLELAARVKFRQGRIGEARLAAELASRLRPNDPDVNYLLGRLSLEQSLADAATRHFLKAARLAGEDPARPRAIAALYELGLTLESTARPVAAAQAFSRFDLALAAAPAEARRAPEVAAILAEHPRGLTQRAVDLFGRTGMQAEAIDAARQLAAARPNEKYAKRMLVLTLLDGGQATEAAAMARGMLDDRGQGPVGLAVLTASAAGKLDTWLRELEAGVTTPEGAAGAQHVARAVDRLGINGKSIQLWKALVRAAPEDAGYAWALAGAQRDAGDLDGAVLTLAASCTARGAASPFDGVSCELIASWRQVRDAARPLSARAEAIGRREDATAMGVVGLALASVGDDAGAAQRFDAALERDPASSVALVGRALLNLRLARWDDALRDAKTLAEHAPERALAHWLIAEAHLGLDQYPEAKAAYQQALKLDTDSVTFRLALARLARRTDDLLGAQRYLQDACELDATRGDVLEELVSSYLEGGKLDLARASLDEAEEADIPRDAMRRARTLLRFAPDLTNEAYIAELRWQRSAHPDDSETAFALANSLFALDRFDEIDALLDSIKPRDDRAREQVDYLRARLHLRRLENGDAITLLEGLARRYPNRQATLGVLASAYAADFRMDDARRIYAHMLDLPMEQSQREQIRRLWIASLADLMAYDAAVEQLDAWIASDPNDGALTELKLDVLIAAERGDDAIALARERLAPLETRFNSLIDEYRATYGGKDATPARLSAIEKELRDLSEAVYVLRESLVQTATAMKRNDVLDSTLRTWLEREPGQMQLRAWSIEAALASDRPDDALAALREITPQTALDLARAVSWRARALALQGKTDEAATDLRSLLKEPAIRANPRLLAAMRRALVQTLVEDEDYQEAVRLTEEWLVDAESDEAMQYELLTLQRSIHLAAERREDHVRVAERLLELEPLDPALNNDLGYTLAEHGEQLDRAEEMIRRAVAADPLNPAYLDSLGWVYYQRGAFADAHRFLSRAAKMRAGQDPVVFSHLGDAEHRLGRVSDARISWARAIDLIEKTAPGDRQPSENELLAALQARLAALGSEHPAEVAPTAAEREEKDRP